jgi:DNA helicase-2/ATP-dependent DNA helicase PcrA
VNKPSRGLGAKAVEKVVDYAMDECGGDLRAALEAMSGNFSAKVSEAVRRFVQLFKNVSELLNAASGVELGSFAAQNSIPGEVPPSHDSIIKWSAGLSETVASLIEGSGLATLTRVNDEAKGESRLGNLQELVNSASLYEGSRAGLREFLENIELDRSAAAATDEEVADAVTLITLHNTKGLEFRKVLMTGVEQGIFPRYDKSGAELEEERRLFYVGVTRAMDELYLTCAGERRVYGSTMTMRPSVFLREVREAEADVKWVGEWP